MKGKKPTVQQRNALKRKVKNDWENYLFIKELIIDLDSDNNHLTKDGLKERYYIFKHKNTGEELKVKAKR